MAEYKKAQARYEADMVAYEKKRAELDGERAKGLQVPHVDPPKRRQRRRKKIEGEGVDDQ